MSNFAIRIRDFLWSNKFFIGILIVGIILIGAWRTWSEQQQVTITTDKTEYEQGETVKIIVENNLNKAIWYHIGSCSPVAPYPELSMPIRIQQLQNETWKPVMSGCRCLTCKGWTSSQLIKLNPNESLTREWKQKIANGFFGSNCSVISADKGIYRTTFTYYGLLKGNNKSPIYTCPWRDLIKNGTTIYSNEFTIKE